MGDLKIQPQHVSGSDLLEGGYRETELGLLPEDWEVMKLGEVAIIKGSTSKLSQLESSLDETRRTGILVLSLKVSDMNLPVNRRVISQAAAQTFISQEEASRLSLVPPDSTVLPKRGAAIATNKKRITSKFSLLDPNLLAVVPGPRLQSRFLLAWFEQLDLRAITDQTTLPQLNIKDLRPLPIPVPSLPEQQTIAYVLSSIQEAKEATEKVIESTRELKRSLMNHLFTYGPVPVDEADQVLLKETEVGRVPVHWDVMDLHAIADLTSGGTPSKKRSDFWRGPIPWVSPKDLKRLRLSDAEDHISAEALENGSRLAPVGAIFVVVRGMILARDVPLAMTISPMAFNQDLKAILPREHVDPEYLLYALIAHKKYLVREIGTSAHGTRRIGGSSLSRWKVPLPGAQEQRLMAAALSTVDHKIEAEETRKLTLDVLFKTLLHNLMTAKIRVQDLVRAETGEVI